MDLWSVGIRMDDNNMESNTPILQHSVTKNNKTIIRMLIIKEITSKVYFKSLEQEWMELLNNSSANSVFLTFRWLFNWWDIFHKKKNLKIFLVYDRYNLIGIIPLFLQKTKYFELFYLNELKILGSGEIGSDYLDFIIYRGREREVLEAVFNYLKTQVPNWDCIKLENISEESNNIKKIIETSQNNKLYSCINTQTQCPFISLPKSWIECESTLSGNMRYNIRRKRKKLEKGHEIELKLIKDKFQLDKALKDFIRLNRLRMETKGILGAFRLANFTQFQKKIIPQLFDDGILKLFFLMADKSPIACLYILQFKKKYYYYQAGLDPEWDKFSPGIVIFSYCIRHAIENEMEEFDFLQGDESYKTSWAKTKRTVFEITILRKTIKNSIVYYIEKHRPQLSKVKKWILKNNR